VRRLYKSFGVKELIKLYHLGLGSSVGIATDYGLDGPGIESTECGQGTRHWEWTRVRLALMLRTDKRWILTEWLLRPHFHLWPPPRHRAVLWTLATYIAFRTQRGTLSDLYDFFRRAKRKMYQSRNRMRLVGNYLDVLEQ
jgi:hypothetical protein